MTSTNPYVGKSPEELLALLTIFNEKKNLFENKVKLIREILEPQIVDDDITIYVAKGDKIYSATRVFSDKVVLVDKEEALRLGLARRNEKFIMRCAALSEKDTELLAEEEKRRLFDEQEDHWDPIRNAALKYVEGGIVDDEPPLPWEDL